MAFQKGQSGNPGGRPSETRQQLSALLDEAFPVAKRKKLIKLLVEDATSDEYDRRKDARPLLLAYTFGKPTEYREISGPDSGPIEITDARNQLASVLSHALAGRDTGGTSDGDSGVATIDSDDPAH